MTRPTQSVLSTIDANDQKRRPSHKSYKSSGNYTFTMDSPATTADEEESDHEEVFLSQAANQTNFTEDEDNIGEIVAITTSQKVKAPGRNILSSLEVN